MPDTFQNTNDASQLYIPFKGFICTTNEAYLNAIRNIPKTNGICIITKSIDTVSKNHSLYVRRTLDLKTFLLITRQNAAPKEIELPFYQTCNCINFIYEHAPNLQPVRISYADIESLVDMAVKDEYPESQMQIKRPIFEALNQLIESVWNDEEQRLAPTTRIRSLSY